jgi:hypothetical protein
VTESAACHSSRSASSHSIHISTKIPINQYSFINIILREENIANTNVSVKNAGIEKGVILSCSTTFRKLFTKNQKKSSPSIASAIALINWCEELNSVRGRPRTSNYNQLSIEMMHSIPSKTLTNFSHIRVLDRAPATAGKRCLASDSARKFGSRADFNGRYSSREYSGLKAPEKRLSVSLARAVLRSGLFSTKLV